MRLPRDCAQKQTDFFQSVYILHFVHAFCYENRFHKKIFFLNFFSRGDLKLFELFAKQLELQWVETSNRQKSLNFGLQILLL